MPREYFPSKFHLDNPVRYFLWSRDLSGDDVDRDEAWTREAIAPTFATRAEVETFAREVLDITVVDEGEPILHDLSWVARWLRRGKRRRAREMRAHKSLAAWNIFSDLARSLEIPFSGDAAELTDLWTRQLFGDPQRWGGHPYLSSAELEATHNVLHEGLALWRAHVR